MIMTCPKCKGTGKIYPEPGEHTTGFAQYSCPSCDGKGYVTDVPGPTVRDVETVYFGSIAKLKCPYCHQEINVHVTIGE